MPTVALKIDVDTDRGTRDGVLPLAEICLRHQVPATFFFSLGPDHTGRAIRRILRPGFFSKVSRTKVASNYGWKTLLYGTVLPGPMIGERHRDTMRHVADSGFEVGIHCWDHFTWQDFVHRMSLETVRRHLERASETFVRIFGQPARCAAAPGWQTCAISLEAYDAMGFDYASDTRGLGPFIPLAMGKPFRTPQIPTDLPTLDERLGLPGRSPQKIAQEITESARREGFHVLTLHAELEGLRYAGWFDSLLGSFDRAGIEVVPLRQALKEELPKAEVIQGEILGRSGPVALRGPLACEAVYSQRT